MEKEWVNKWAELCDSTEADDEFSYVYDGPEVDKRIEKLEADNARLRQQRDAANAQIDAMLEEMEKDYEGE
jgi:hypothetical protein